MVLRIFLQKFFPFLSIFFRRIIKILLPLQFIHILDIIQEINIYCRNIPVLNCEVITVSSRLIVWKCVSASLSPFFAFRIKTSFIVVPILLSQTSHPEYTIEASFMCFYLLDVRIPKKVANIFKKIISDKNTPEIVQIL